MSAIGGPCLPLALVAALVAAFGAVFGRRKHAPPGRSGDTSLDGWVLREMASQLSDEAPVPPERIVEHLAGRVEEAELAAWLLQAGFDASIEYRYADHILEVTVSTQRGAKTVRSRRVFDWSDAPDDVRAEILRGTETARRPWKRPNVGRT